MKQMILVMVLFLTTNTQAENYSFKDLAKIVSADIKTNIYIDKELEDYKIDMELEEYREPGQTYEFFKIVLLENSMKMVYNKKGNFYYVSYDNGTIDDIQARVLPAKPIPNSLDRNEYYSYRIKNITNKDVVKVMSIFDVKFTYLEQSDIIAYSATKIQHKSISRMLKSSDNTVSSATIKITLFTTNYNKMISYGSNIRAFDFSFDSSLNGIFSALKNGNSQKFNIQDKASFNFSLFAMKGRGLVNVYQEPTILVTNGIKAKVNYVKTLAYKTSSSTIVDNQQRDTTQLEYRDIGFKIEIVPKISDKWVFLDLNLISEELLTQDDNQVPVTQKISYKNSIKIYRNKPVLLTGLKKSSQFYEKNGIPLLQDIPVLGEIFKSKRKEKKNEYINIMIEVI